MKFEFTEDMNEICGLGGAYERALRLAVTAGAGWWSLHPEASPGIDVDDRGCRGSNEAGERLVRAIDSALFTADDGVKVELASVLTPSMYYAAMYHIMWIGEHGWDAYVAAMRLPVRFYHDDDNSVEVHRERRS